MDSTHSIFTGAHSANELPLISVIVATYNGERFIKEQLESISKQTYLNIEIIVTDDKSTDQTVKILQDYAMIDPRVKLLLNNENLGYAKNFFRGCSEAGGALIALSDQDDIWLPEKLEKLMNKIGKHAMIYADSELCDETLNATGNLLSDRIQYMDYDNCLQQAVFGRIPGHAMLFTKQLFQYCLPASSAVNHDWWLSFGATLYGGIVYLPEPLVKYRQHTSNLFGAIGNSKRKKTIQEKKNIKRQQIKNARDRIKALYEFCPLEFAEEKKVLLQLCKSYRDFSFSNNFLRMKLFFKNADQLLASKKRNKFRKFLFCIKMFYKIE